MRIVRLSWVLPFFLLTSMSACRKTDAPRVETKSQTKATNPDGSQTTTSTEARQVGSTLASKTETTGRGANGKEKSVSETVVGTVTDYAPGKRIVVLTADGAKHDFDLADKKASSSIDRTVTVGTKVRLDSTRDDAGNRTIRVVTVADR